MTGVVAKALDFATKAHGDQVRKYTGEPYTNHLVEVMNIVRTVKSDDSMLAAALLHDTIEDTSITETDVQKEFVELCKNTYKSQFNEEFYSSTFLRFFTSTSNLSSERVVHSIILSMLLRFSSIFS